jgi:hypothetical protein
MTAYRAALAGKPRHVAIAEGEAAYQAALAEQSPPPQSPNSTNPAEALYDLAALHCILLPAEGSDRSRALAAAADCFALARYCPSEAEVAEQFLALAALLPTADDAGQSQTAPAPPQRTRKPRQPTLASVAKQASKAGVEIARYEFKPDGTVVAVTGKPAPAESENPWSLDEFRTKETKQ